MKNKAYRINKYYGIALSVLTAVLAVLFIVQAVGIFAEGGFEQGAYSRELVAAKLFPISFVLYLWIAAVIVAYVLSETFKVEPSRSLIKDDRTSLKRLLLRVPAPTYDNVAENKTVGKEESIRLAYDNFAEYKAVRREETVRLICRIVFAVVCVVCAVMCAIYTFSEYNFPAEDLNGEMLAMLINIAPYIGVVLVLSVVLVYYEKYSVKRELFYVKKLIAAGERGCDTCNPLTGTPLFSFFGKLGGIWKRVRDFFALAPTKWAVRGVIMVVGIVFVVLGITNKGMQEVFLKAINICTECIGLG